MGDTTEAGIGAEWENERERERTRVWSTLGKGGLKGSIHHGTKGNCTWTGAPEHDRPHCSTSSTTVTGVYHRHLTCTVHSLEAPVTHHCVPNGTLFPIKYTLWCHLGLSK
jgi:hypothetical protein